MITLTHEQLSHLRDTYKFSYDDDGDILADFFSEEAVFAIFNYYKNSKKDYIIDFKLWVEQWRMHTNINDFVSFVVHNYSNGLANDEDMLILINARTILDNYMDSNSMYNQRAADLAVNIIHKQEREYYHSPICQDKSIVRLTVPLSNGTFVSPKFVY